MRLKNLKAIVLLTFSLVAFDTMAIGYTLKLSEADLQERVSAMMPLEKKQLFLTVVISDPQISLLPDTDQVGVFLNVDAIIASRFKRLWSRTGNRFLVLRQIAWRILLKGPSFRKSSD